MNIKYTGSGVHVRQVEGHVWDVRINGHVVNVTDAEVIGRLLSMPRSRLNGAEFVIDESEPLLQWLTVEQAALLALEAKIADVVQFSKLKSGGIGKVAEVLEVEESVVSAWVAEAKSAPAPAFDKPVKSG